MKKVGVGKFTLGAVLIILGIAFTLETTGVGIESRAVDIVLRYWPVVLIGLGVEFLLVARDREVRARLSVPSVLAIAFLLTMASALNFGSWLFYGWDWGWNWGWGGPLSDPYVITVPVNESADSLDAIKLTGVGQVEITGSTGSGVTGSIEISVRARSYSEAQDIAEDLRVDITKSGRTLVIDGPRPSGLFRSINIRLNTTLSVPEDWDVEVASSAGNTNVTGIRGEINVRSSAGTVTLDGLAREVDVSVSAGNLWASLGPDMESFDGSVSAGNLNLTVPNGVGATIEASSSAGNIQCSLPGVEVTKSAASSRASGTIGSGACRVDLRSSAGNVTIR